MRAKVIVQYARYMRDEQILQHLSKIERQEALTYLRKLDEPLLIRRLLQSEDLQSEEKPSPNIYPYIFTKPDPSDGLIAIAIELLIEEFLDYIEKRYFVTVGKSDHKIVLNSFEKLDYDALFWDFLTKRYSDDNLKYRWSLVKALYNLKPYFNPFEIKKSILENRIPLENRESPSLFNDSSGSNCLFCGREIVDSGLDHEAKGGFADFAKQKPQSDFTNRNAIVCSICLFASCVSLIRTSNPQGLRYSANIVLISAHDKEPYEAVFNRLAGISVGSFFAMKNAGTQIDKYGKTAVTHLVASTVPTEFLVDQSTELMSNASEEPLDKKKILAIKSFEEIIGFRKMYKPTDESSFRKIHYDILKGNPFSIFGHLAGFAQKKEIVDNGIYRLVKDGVIDLDEAKIVFGSALLIDAFLPKSWESTVGDVRTDTRKVAYYLEQPEEVLYRLRRISDETANITRTFSNEASYKLLKDLLQMIYEKEDYGAFADKVKQNDKGQEYLHLSLDDILKVYLYIRDYLLEKHRGQDEHKMMKTYSDFMAKIKYALVARRPELIEKGGA